MLLEFPIESLTLIHTLSIFLSIKYSHIDAYICSAIFRNELPFTFRCPCDDTQYRERQSERESVIQQRIVSLHIGTNHVSYFHFSIVATQLSYVLSECLPNFHVKHKFRLHSYRRRRRRSVNIFVYFPFFGSAIFRMYMLHHSRKKIYLGTKSTMFIALRGES